MMALEGEEAFFSLLLSLLSGTLSDGELDQLAASGAFESLPYAAGRPECLEGLALLGEWAEERQAGEDCGELQDHLALFGGVGKPLVSPWESSYLNPDEGLVFQEGTLDVRTWYKRMGLEPARKYREPDDSILLEVEFVVRLGAMARSAIFEERPADAVRCLEVRRGFFENHLLKWCYGWCEDVYELAQSKLYKGAAKLLAGGLREAEALIW